MNTNNHEAIILLALDALVFADRISTGWPEEKQLRHLREQIALAQKHLESDPAETMKLAQREIETLRACKDAEMRWEILMMRLVGEDVLGSAEQAISALKKDSEKLAGIRETLYGQNLMIAGWHLNGDLEPIDSFFEENDWEPSVRPTQESES